MKTKIIFLIGLILFLIIFNFNSALAKRGNNSEADSIYVAGQMLLQFNSQAQAKKGLVSSPYLDSLNQAFSVQTFGPFYYMDSNTDMQLFQELGLDKICLYIFPDTLDMLYVSERYKLSPAVNWAEPNYLGKMNFTPPDEYFPLQWGLQNTGQAPFYGTPGADIEATRAWDINEWVPEIKIAIIDTGIDTLHYDFTGFQSQMWHNPYEDYDGVNDDHNYVVIPPNDTCWLVDDVWGWDFTYIGEYGYCGHNSPRPTHYYGGHSHGTAVAGIAGASAFTEIPEQPEGGLGGSIGVVGVNWSSKLMSLKDCNESGHPSISGTGCALRYAADKGADVINMSVSFGFHSNFLKTSLDYAFGKGCVLVASMGNCEGGCDIIKYPAGYDSVIAVGATDWNDNRWYIDPLNGSSAGRHIDVVAPGVSIMTDLWVWYPPGLHEGYGYFNRTSASAPFVSGEASLIKGQYKKLYPSGVITNIEIRDVIRYSAEDSMYYPVSDTMWDDSLYGYGRINVFRALLAISRGEVDNNHSITVSDITYLINYLTKGGPPPVPVLGIGDANCSGQVSIADVVYLINYVLKGGPKPPFCYKWHY